MTPMVSVVVPTYKRPLSLSRCLDGLTSQEMPPHSYEVLVVDDADSEETRRVVGNWAGRSSIVIRYQLAGPAHGPAAARNAGWRAAHGSIIAFTHDDCIPESRWLKEGLAALAEDVSLVKGRVIRPVPIRPTDYELNAAQSEKAEFATANCFCRKSALEAVGGFDEQFTRASREDSDLFFSLLKQGARVVEAPQSVVIHPVRPATWGVSLRLQKNNFFEALLYKKHRNLYRQRIRPAHPWSFYAMMGLLVVSPVLSASRHPRAAVACLGIWALLTGQFFVKRLYLTTHRFKDVFEMLVTSILIPPVALYWRLRGAVHYRVWFV